MNINDQLLHVQGEIDAVVAKISPLEAKQELSERELIDLASWRKEKEQLRDEKLLLLKQSTGKIRIRSLCVLFRST